MHSGKDEWHCCLAYQRGTNACLPWTWGHPACNHASLHKEQWLPQKHPPKNLSGGLSPSQWGPLSVPQWPTRFCPLTSAGCSTETAHNKNRLAKWQVTHLGRQHIHASLACACCPGLAASKPHMLSPQAQHASDRHSMTRVLTT